MCWSVRTARRTNKTNAPTNVPTTKNARFGSWWPHPQQFVAHHGSLLCPSQLPAYTWSWASRIFPFPASNLWTSSPLICTRHVVTFHSNEALFSSFLIPNEQNHNLSAVRVCLPNTVPLTALSSRPTLTTAMLLCAGRDPLNTDLRTHRVNSLIKRSYMRVGENGCCSTRFDPRL